MTSDDSAYRDSTVKDRDIAAPHGGAETLGAETLGAETLGAETTETTTPDMAVNLLVVIEDDPDVQFLVEAIFAMDPRFSVLQVAESAEEALAGPPTSGPGVIVLDHGLAGPLPGLAAAEPLKEQHPQAKIILFTAHAALQARADKDPSIDAFLLKTQPERLLPMAQELTGLGPSPSQVNGPKVS